jgi:hypothetical protein
VHHLSPNTAGHGSHFAVNTAHVPIAITTASPLDQGEAGTLYGAPGLQPRDERGYFCGLSEGLVAGSGELSGDGVPDSGFKFFPRIKVQPSW